MSVALAVYCLLVLDQTCETGLLQQADSRSPELEVLCARRISAGTTEPLAVLALPPDHPTVHTNR